MKIKVFMNQEDFYDGQDTSDIQDRLDILYDEYIQMLEAALRKAYPDAQVEIINGFGKLSVWDDDGCPIGYPDDDIVYSVENTIDEVFIDWCSKG